MQIKRLLTSCFGLGWMPVAPGTWGSLPPMFIFAILSALDVSQPIVAVVMALLVIFGILACVLLAPAAIAASGSKDPGEVVADELAGQAVTFLAISFLELNYICTASALAFLLFRFFDITKPWPVRKLEKLPAGYGICADDLLAGVYAAIVFIIIHNFGIVDKIGKFLCT